MSDFIRLLLSLSISGSIIAIILFAIKPLIKHKLSKSIQYYIWLVVLLRLVVPLSFEESIMNHVFYDDTEVVTVSPVAEVTADKNFNSINFHTIEEKTSEPLFNKNSDTNTSNKISLVDLLNNIQYIWILGVIIALAFNLTGYFKFLKQLRLKNLPANIDEKNMLYGLLGGKKKVRLVRNSLVTTPMLVGIIRPYIVIPDEMYNETQLKNILLHEVTHLKRFDIVIKWLTMIVTSIHWFNPLMYYVKNQINHACELSCDEAVIKKLNSKEKQAYGDTLISVVANNKYPVGVLQATMSEQKETIKERLISIMKYSKKTKSAIIMSIVLLAIVISTALFLGACNIRPIQSGGIIENVNYRNDKYGFSLELPKDFSDKVTIKEEEDILYFAYKEVESSDPDVIMGIVGRIEVYDKNIYTKDMLKEKEDSYGFNFLGENEHYYFGWATSTDVQVPPNASKEVKDNYNSLENKFREVLKTFKQHSPVIENQQISGEFYIKRNNTAVSVGDWDNKVDMEGVFGTKLSENTETLENADTFTGMFVKTIEYQGAMIRLYSPSDNGKTFWIQNVMLTSDEYEILSGIKIGDSFDSVKDKLGDRLIGINVLDGNQVYSYGVNYDMIVFDFSNNILNTIEVKREMP